MSLFQELRTKIFKDVVDPASAESFFQSMADNPLEGRGGIKDTLMNTGSWTKKVQRLSGLEPEDKRTELTKLGKFFEDFQTAKAMPSGTTNQAHDRQRQMNRVQDEMYENLGVGLNIDELGKKLEVLKVDAAGKKVATWDKADIGKDTELEITNQVKMSKRMSERMETWASAQGKESSLKADIHNKEMEAFVQKNKHQIMEARIAEERNRLMSQYNLQLNRMVSEASGMKGISESRIDRLSYEKDSFSLKEWTRRKKKKGR